MIFSFEYTNCLERVEVQLFCKELRERGVDIIIISSCLGEDFKMNNKETIENIMFAINIPLDFLYFTNYCKKSNIINSIHKVDVDSYILHVDSSSSCLRDVNRNTEIQGININDENWRSQINDVYLNKLKINDGK